MDPEKEPELRIARVGEMASNLMGVRRHYASPPNQFIVMCPRNDRERLIAQCAAIHHSDDDAELKNVIVDPEFQGRGLGPMLMDTVDTWTRTHAYRHIHLWTYAHLAVATTMYERRRYARAEREFGHEVFTNLDPVYMEKAIRQRRQGESTLPDYEVRVTQVYAIEAQDPQQAAARAAELEEAILPAYSAPDAGEAPTWVSEIQDSQARISPL